MAGMNKGSDSGDGEEGYGFENFSLTGLGDQRE